MPKIHTRQFTVDFNVVKDEMVAKAFEKDLEAVVDHYKNVLKYDLDAVITTNSFDKDGQEI